MINYKSVLKNSSDEIIIEKSRFIGHSFHIDSVEEAEEYIKNAKKKYYDATHNCYAYILNEDMSIMKSSDDGEPSSTAGIPMLEVLKKENITNCLVIATRYFGGIKLGAGGLVRAYTKTAKIAIDSNTIIEKRVFKNIACVVDYSFVGKIQKFIENKSILASMPEFSEKVKFDLYETQDNIEKLKQELLDMTSAKCIIQEKELKYIDFIDNIAQL